MAVRKVYKMVGRLASRMVAARAEWRAEPSEPPLVAVKAVWTAVERDNWKDGRTAASTVASLVALTDNQPAGSRVELWVCASVVRWARDSAVQ